MTVARRQPRRRHMNEWVGAFVLATVVVLVLAMLQSARVQRWFDPGLHLTVILPQQGLFGLSAGSEVQVLGTQAGSVREITIDPESGRILADVRVQAQFAAFIRSDSVATIRRKLAVAGDAYLDITRGSAEPLDWELAVIEAQVDAAPTDALNRLLTQVEQRAVPVFDNLDKTVEEIRNLTLSINDPEGDVQGILANLHSITGKIDSGDGTIGRLVNDDRLYNDVVELAEKVSASIDRLDPVLERAQAIAADLAVVSAALRESSDDFPELVERANATLMEIRAVVEDLRRASGDLPELSRNLAETSRMLPGLAVQAQQTLRQIEQLAERARNSWLLGGDGGGDAPRRLAPAEAQP